MRTTVIDFGMGVVMGGLALSACWGWLWAVVGTIGAARGACRLRVVMNGLVVGISPIVLGWAAWGLRPQGFATNGAFVAGISVMPLLLTGLALRRAPDGRAVGVHLMDGIRHLNNELLGTHRDCGDCGHDHGADRPGELP